MKKNLLIDCDGVLYPTSQLSTAEIAKAMNDTVRDYGIDKDAYERASQRAKDANALGIFNFIKILGAENRFEFKDFCRDMVEKIDYSRITRDDHLLSLLRRTSEKYNPMILTNNCPEHVEKVLARRFGRTRQTFGIPCYDITYMEYNGRFYSKRMEIGLKMFCNKIGINPRDTTIVEDTPGNIEIAEAVGMSGVLIGGEKSLNVYLEALLSRPFPEREFFR